MRPEEIHHEKVLIAPLDWGMGHTTRCVSLIRQFIEQDCEVIFAGNSSQRAFIQKDFPTIIFEHIEGYNVTLDSKKSTYTQMLQQGLKLKAAIRTEAKRAKELVAQHHPTIIVSDNRYGFRSNQVTSILMTHQLSPPVPNFRKTLTRLLKGYINSFDCCWVPDDPGQPLVHELNNVELTIPKVLIGFLSRFNQEIIEKRFDFLVISSGPLPERHYFEQKMHQLLDSRSVKFVCSDDAVIQDACINPSTLELQKLINEAQLVVSKCGYTTVMEMIAIQQICWLIPTPNQYEQEWLSEHLSSPFILTGDFQQFIDYLATFEG